MSRAGFRDSLGWLEVGRTWSEVASPWNQEWSPGELGVARGRHLPRFHA
jgi:hypothetical protein